MAFKLFQNVQIFTWSLLVVVLTQVLTATKADASDIDFAKTQLCLADEQVIDVELAVTTAQQRQGLMFRESLAEHSGMLFVYDTSATRAFWMMNTLIPLDIAYVNNDGVINEILTMQPCRSRVGVRCPSYPSTQPFRYALEMNSGWFGHSNITDGERLKGGDCETPLADWIESISSPDNE